MTNISSKSDSQRIYKIYNFLEKYGTLLAILLICIIFSFLTHIFIQIDNILSILVQSSAIGIVSMGLTLVMITGNLDLSFGSIIGLSGMTTAFLLSVEYSSFTSIIVGLCIGIIFGFINGILVVKIRIESLVATIATQAIIFGLAYFYSGGVDIHSGRNKFFKFISEGSIGAIPMPVILLLIILFIGIFVTQFTAIGRYFYAIGGNPIAAKFSGIRISYYKIIAYIISGFLASISGILMLSRLGYGAAYTGQGYLLDGFAAVFVGLTILKSGKPNMTGSVVGAMFMSILNNGFQLLNINFVIQILLKGIALLSIVIVYSKLSAKKNI